MAMASKQNIDSASVVASQPPERTDAPHTQTFLPNYALLR